MGGGGGGSGEGGGILLVFSASIVSLPDRGTVMGQVGIAVVAVVLRHTRDSIIMWCCAVCFSQHCVCSTVRVQC